HRHLRAAAAVLHLYAADAGPVRLDRTDSRGVAKGNRRRVAGVLRRRTGEGCDAPHVAGVQRLQQRLLNDGHLPYPAPACHASATVNAGHEALEEVRGRRGEPPLTTHCPSRWLFNGQTSTGPEKGFSLDRTAQQTLAKTATCGLAVGAGRRAGAELCTDRC